MVNSKLLTEIERQKKYLGQLPEQFNFPLFNSKKALESQRQSGYRNTAAAAREIVDNSLEGQSDRVHIVFDRPSDKRKSRERRNRVTAVAFIDNGSGMLPEMARYALSWGGGTHFDEPDFIGKFGFGLPNASINQTRCVEVFTRTAASEPIYMARLNIDDYTGEGVSQEVKPPIKAELPQFVSDYLTALGWNFDHGTVVVWVQPDRLTYRTDSSLREHLLDDFGATYRYLLRNFELVVDGKKVEVLDPLFLDSSGRFFLKSDDGGAQIQYDEPIAVKLVEDPETGERQLLKVESPEELADPQVVAAGGIHIRVARFPLGFVVGSTGDAGIKAIDDHSRARFDIRKSRKGMSFVRSGREIETVDAFPRRASDKASGLGDWPLLQSYAYHWGLEVSFTPSLDAVFGITNDKQQVRPLEDFWRLLTEEGIDDLLRREDMWQREQRRDAAKAARKAKLELDSEGTSPAESASTSADVSIGEDPDVPETRKAEAGKNFERAVNEKSKTTNKSIEEAEQALIEQRKRKKYQISYYDEERGPFYVPEWVGTQVVVRINRRHPFFLVLYDSVLALEEGALAKEAIDVLLITLARAELMAKNEETIDFYREQRETRWSPFLSTALKTLERKFPSIEEDIAA